MESLWDLFHRIYDVETIVRVRGLAAPTAIVFVETGLLVGFFLPGDSLLVTAGIFAARGDLDIVTLDIVLRIAAVAGDTVGYAIGRRTGPKIFKREDSLIFRRKHLLAAQEFYEKHGGFTIVVARFIPIIRPGGRRRSRHALPALHRVQRLGRHLLGPRHDARRLLPRQDISQYRREHPHGHRRRDFRFTAAGDHQIRDGKNEAGAARQVELWETGPSRSFWESSKG